ncbi:MAG: addiction module protein [Nitrospirae bacterium]|nr:addiction module protein [Nitrospirota bacterium]
MKKEIDELWAAEAEKRVEDIRTGKVKTIPGDEVFKEIRDKYNLWIKN